MAVDLSKLVLYTPDNAFKNVTKYNGSITFPTSVPGQSSALVTTSFVLPDTPVYTEFFANFLEESEAISLYGTGYGTTPTRWYGSNVHGNFDIGVYRTLPTSGWYNAGLFPTVNGNIVTINGYLFNGSNAATFNSVTVPFVFLAYTLAS